MMALASVAECSTSVKLTEMLCGADALAKRKQGKYQWKLVKVSYNYALIQVVSGHIQNFVIIHSVNFVIIHCVKE